MSDDIREELSDVLGREFGRWIVPPVKTETERIADALIARFPWIAEKRETEWGWRSFFADGEEYEWLPCHSREEAEQQIRDYQAEEDENGEVDGRLTYSLWSRTKGVPGQWEKATA